MCLRCIRSLEWLFFLLFANSLTTQPVATVSNRWQLFYGAGAVLGALLSYSLSHGFTWSHRIPNTLPIWESFVGGERTQKEQGREKQELKVHLPQGSCWCLAHAWQLAAPQGTGSAALRGSILI